MLLIWWKIVQYSYIQINTRTHIRSHLKFKYSYSYSHLLHVLVFVLVNIVLCTLPSFVNIIQPAFKQSTPDTLIIFVTYRRPDKYWSFNTMLTYSTVNSRQGPYKHVQNFWQVIWVLARKIGPPKSPSGSPSHTTQLSTSLAMISMTRPPLQISGLHVHEARRVCMDPDHCWVCAFAWIICIHSRCAYDDIISQK